MGVCEVPAMCVRSIKRRKKIPWRICRGVVTLCPAASASWRCR